MIWTDANWVELGTTSAFALDIAFGEDENDFSIKCGTDVDIPFGALVYIDGTSFGGIVRGIEYSNMDGMPCNIYSGDAWQGVLGHSVIRPNSGQDYYTITGDLNANIATVISRQTLGGLFDVESTPCGVSATYQFERYCTAYSGLTKMLKSKGYKLHIEKEASSKPKISAVPVGDYANDGQSYESEFSMKEEKPVNHLVCLGSGDLRDRVVIDLFADANGNVSSTQTLFGIDEIEEVYEYSNADAAKLRTEGTKKLKAMQATRTADLSAPDGIDLDIGDIVGVHDDDTGRSLTSSVAKVVVKVTDSGMVKKSYALADISATF